MTIGTLLRKAGFRWVFPIGTMPLPFHPAILLLVVSGPPLWIAWLGWSAFAGHGATPRWWQPLIVALLLGIPLSIPVVAWALMVFRAHLAQAILIAGSMLLLALDVVTGKAHMLWGALPVAFVLLYLVQAIGGRIVLARLREQAAAWQPIDPGDRTVSVDGERFTGQAARQMLEHCNIARMVSIPGKPPRGVSKARLKMLHFLSEDAVDTLQSAFGKMPPPEWTIPKPGNQPIVARPIEAVPDGCIMVTMKRYRSPFWVVGGKLLLLRVRDGGATRDFVNGIGSVIAKVPLFTFFHWTSLTGHNSRHVGFMREKAMQFGAQGNVFAPLVAAFAPRPADGGRADDRTMASGDIGLSKLMELAEADEQPLIDQFWSDMALYPGWGAGGPMVERLRDTPQAVPAGRRQAARRLAGHLQDEAAQGQRDQRRRAAPTYPLRRFHGVQGRDHIRIE